MCEFSSFGVSLVVFLFLRDFFCLVCGFVNSLVCPFVGFRLFVGRLFCSIVDWVGGWGFGWLCGLLSSCFCVCLSCFGPES